MSSIPVAKSELFLFEPSSTQVCMSNAQWVDVHPLNSVKGNSSPITFSIQGSEKYLDLNDTVLYLRLKIENKDTTNDIAPVNNLLSSLFSDCQLEIGDKVVEGSDFLYPYKAYIHSLLNYSTDTKKNNLLSSGFVKDESGKFDSIENIGRKTRGSWLKKNNSVELMGPLIAVKLWGESFTHKSVSFYNDNPAAAAAIIKKCAKLQRLDLNWMIRQFALIAIKNRFSLIYE